MLLLYTLGIRLYHFIIWILSPFNEKARQFTSGRKNIFKRIAEQINPNESHIWFHFASLGEFEQGRPVLEKLKALHPNKKIIITFFSPSGYEIRKSYALAEAVFYLPMDSPGNAKRLVKLINPEIVIFTKYEFWPNYFKILAQKHIPLYVISGIFRKDQVFFKNYGGFYRQTLRYVNHFFLQNTESKRLLDGIGITNNTISGDTRFDRVYENALASKKLAEIDRFIGDAPAVVCGSTWPEDEKLLSVLPTKYHEWKFIIAPHEVNEAHIQTIENLFPEDSLRFSKLNDAEVIPFNSRILIIDNIGMLSSLYPYGQIAYIGGGFGAGIHNTLEAAAFGVPVLFGPKYQKFQEAKDLIELQAARSISNAEELQMAFEAFRNDPDASKAAAKYVFDQKGATNTILNYLYP